MLPAPKTGGVSLADVMESCLSAVLGRSNRLGLPPVERAIVVLVDGLGAESLKALAGHARTLAGALGPHSVIESGFPTTTASALASLTTGQPSGQTGMVGYTVLDPENDRVVNELSGWDTRLDPFTWQPVSTVFERAAAAGLQAVAIGPERYRGSGFSHAVLRGAEYLGGASVADRFAHGADWARKPGRGIAYLYLPELDQAGHAHGWQSDRFSVALESVDAALRDLATELTPRAGLLVTADHGMVDVPSHSHVLFDSSPELIDGVRFVAGEPRCLQLHFEPDASAELRERVVSAWRASESERAWVVTRDEAIEANWFGEVRPEVKPRIGDLLIAARKSIAYYDSRATGSGRSMIGQHGSWSPAELRVPLLRYVTFQQR